MNNLTDVLDKMNEQDKQLLEKQAQDKLAADEADAAGRITARGFVDELTKLAEQHLGRPGE